MQAVLQERSRQDRMIGRKHRRRALDPADRVSALLERYRSRADRHRHLFSAVVFHSTATRRGLHRTARILAQRVRLTDEIGWIGPSDICAILPDTSATGARAFAADAADRVARRDPRPTYTVYTYPSAHAHEEDPANAFAARTLLPHISRNHPLRSAFVAGFDSKLNHHAVPAQSLESWFVRPLPAWKRALDIVGALLLLIPALPLMALAVAAIRVTSSGSAIFRQHRAGLGGKAFLMYKLRTMYADAEQRKRELMAHNEQDGPAFKIAKDPRITPIGAILRKTSLDELPQLFNVLFGDMSLVGPRPLPCDEANACDSWHRRRLEVTPGLTCIWQIKGRSSVTFEQWMRMDLDYLRRRTLFADALLMLQTLPAVLLRKGAK